MELRRSDRYHLYSYLTYPRALLAGNLIQQGAVAVEAGEGGLRVYKFVIAVEEQVRREAFE